ADSSLHDYKAQAHGFLFFLGAFGQGLADPPRLVKADQLELEVYWRAPASSKQRVIGWRDQTQLPTDINYHRDHLGIIQNNFGAARRGSTCRCAASSAPGGRSTATYSTSASRTAGSRATRSRSYRRPSAIPFPGRSRSAPRSRTSPSRCARTTWSACARRWSRS